MLHAFSREELLLGADAIQKLAASHVAVFGVGGVGSFACEALARAGIGELTLIDNDTVSLTNRNRQMIALASTTGQPKVEVMRARIADINPHCIAHALQMFYTPDSVLDLTQFDYVIDAIDTVTAKLHLITECDRLGVPLICSMGTGNKLDPGKLTFTDLAKTSVCPLARVMRRELKKRGIVHHQVLYSTEEPIRCPGATVPGSVAWVPSCAGLMMAGKIVLSLTKD